MILTTSLTAIFSFFLLQHHWNNCRGIAREGVIIKGTTLPPFFQRPAGAIRKFQEWLVSLAQLPMTPYKIMMKDKKYLGAAAYQLGNTSCRTITEVKPH